MNKVILMGRLTRDPDVRVSAGETPVTVVKYTLAVDRRRKKDEGEQGADFIPCTAFSQNAEFAEKYFHQGIKIVIVGRIQTGSYTNKDGQKVYTTEVIIEDQYFAESKAASGRTAPGNAASADGFMNLPTGVEDEGLPFN